MTLSRILVFTLMLCAAFPIGAVSKIVDAAVAGDVLRDPGLQDTGAALNAPQKRCKIGILVSRTCHHETAFAQNTIEDRDDRLRETPMPEIVRAVGVGMSHPPPLGPPR